MPHYRTTFHGATSTVFADENPDPDTYVEVDPADETVSPPPIDDKTDDDKTDDKDDGADNTDDHTSTVTDTPTDDVTTDANADDATADTKDDA
jgi:hypothetical protein